MDPFASVPEQTEAKRLLGAALTEGGAHAYLLHGPAGVGKRTAAFAFAGALLGDARRVELRSHPDLYLLEPLGEMIRIDDVRALRHDLHMRPFEGGPYIVYREGKLFAAWPDQEDLTEVTAAFVEGLKRLPDPDPAMSGRLVGTGLLALAPLVQTSAMAAPLTSCAQDAASARAFTPPPDIVLIVLDDVGLQRLIDVRDAGYAPNLTAIADEGFVFLNANSAPICSPTRRMIYFGDFYSRQSGFGCSSPTGEEPPASSVSIAALLATQGYSSALIGKWHCGANLFGGGWQGAVLGWGWDHFQAGVQFFVSGNEGGCLGTGYNQWTEVTDGTSAPSFEYQPGEMMERFESLWATMPSPKFVTYSAQLAHAPYHRPPESMLPPGYPATATNGEKHDAMIATLDVQVGQILATVGPNTVVIVVSDNGTPQGIDSNPSHAKTTTFQGGVRVPMFMRGPGIPVGSSWSLTSVADLYATLAELGGATPNPALDSRSLVPLFTNPSGTIHSKIAFGIQGDSPQFADDLACRSLRYKFRKWRADPGDPWTEEFYDLFLDEEELVNLIGDPAHATKIANHRAFAEAELP